MTRGSRSRRVTPALVAAVATATMLVAVDSASARRGGHDYAPEYVIAESDFGNGTVRGAVRPGRNGWQVRLPRGTWIDCVRSCSDTLRRQTVDFWESNFRDSPGSGRGYLHWEFWR